MPFGPDYPDVEMTGEDLFIIYVLSKELIMSISVS